jgi:hypothetical protein
MRTQIIPMRCSECRWRSLERGDGNERADLLALLTIERGRPTAVSWVVRTRPVDGVRALPGSVWWVDDQGRPAAGPPLDLAAVRSPSKTCRHGHPLRWDPDDVGRQLALRPRTVWLR